MFVSTLPTLGEEVVQHLSYEELLDLIKTRKITKIDQLGETLYIETPEGFHEVLCENLQEADFFSLDLRLASWADKLILKSNQFWQGKRFQVGATLRFLPYNRIQIGEVDLVGKIRWFDDTEATPRFEVSFGQEQYSRIEVDVDLTKVLVDKKILGITGRKRWSWWASSQNPDRTGLTIGISTLEIDTEEGTVVLWHDQACCEDASLHDFEGDAEDLIGATVRRVIVGTDKEGNPFYDIRTTNGDLWLRFGNGNNTAYSIAMLVGFRRSV